MKTTQKLLSAVLSLSMLLSLLSGAAYAAPGSVTVGQETAFEPLSEEASIAYEQHEDGYEVTLERAAESLTMQITAVPDSGREAEKARLYIRTGVELKAQTSYLVSFDLSAQKALADYTVSLDGDAEGAYGTLSGRGVAERGVDRVREFINPEAESGELVLRLLVGNTEANTLRFSNLAVEEASAEEVAAGPGKVLADKLNLSAPGSVTVWTNSDCGATLDTDGKSATMTVTKTPKGGKEVWKIKLLVATGLMPEAGKTYRFRATLHSSTSGPYEMCYNDGGVEKGYAVLYNQSLKKGEQLLERMVYVTRDKENPGELIAQLSLGMLSAGDKVTISDITVVEASASYRNALASNFALDKTREYGGAVYENTVVSTNSTPESLSVNWANELAITKSGNRAGELTYSGNAASLEIKPTNDAAGVEGSNNNPWEARFNIDLGRRLKPNTSYSVSFQIAAEKACQDCEVLYGSTFQDDFGARDNYEHIRGLQLVAGEPQTVSRRVKTNGNGELLIQLLVGKTPDLGVPNTVTVSNLAIQTLTESDVDLSAMVFPTGSSDGSFTLRTYALNSNPAYCPVVLSGDEHSATFTCLSTDGIGGDNNVQEYKRSVFINSICAPAEAGDYLLSFRIVRKGGVNKNIRIAGYKVDEADKALADGGSYGSRLHEVTDQITTVYYPFTLNDSATVSLRLDLGELNTGTSVTVSNFALHKIEALAAGDDAFSVSYPTGEGCSFEIRDVNDRYVTLESFNNTSATFECHPTPEDELFKRAVFVNGIYHSVAGGDYELRFRVQRIGGSEKNIKLVGFQTDDNNDTRLSGNGSLGSKLHWAESDKIAAFPFHLEAGKTMSLRIDMNELDAGTSITLSDFAVKKQVDPAAGPYSANYQTNAFFEIRDENYGYVSLQSSNATSATFKCFSPNTESELRLWRRGVFFNNIYSISGDTQDYILKFQVVGSGGNDGTITLAGFVRDGEKFAPDGSPGVRREVSGITNTLTVTSTATLAQFPFHLESGQTLGLRIDMKDLAENTVITFSNFQVVPAADSSSATPTSLTFPFPSTEDWKNENKVSFGIRDYSYHYITPKGWNESSVTFQCNAPGEERWRRNIFVNEIPVSEAGDYQLSFNVSRSGGENKYIDMLGYTNPADKLNDSLALGFSNIEVKTEPARAVYSFHLDGTDADRKLLLRIKLDSLVAGTLVTFSDFTLKKLIDPAAGSFSARGYNDNPVIKPVSLIGDGSSYAKVTANSIAGIGNNNNLEIWKRGVFVNDIYTAPAGGGDYQLSFKALRQSGNNENIRVAGFVDTDTNDTKMSDNGSLGSMLHWTTDVESDAAVDYRFHLKGGKSCPCASTWVILVTIRSSASVILS